jgi:O-antigen/teichoic acid export membrane protein
MLDRIKNSEFARNVLVLFSGSLLAQLIPFLVLPILQRYFYDPSAFGLLAIFMVFFELFSRVGTLKLELGLVLQRRIKDAINLAYGALRISMVMALVAFIFVFFFQNELGRFYGIEGFEHYFLLLPLFILLTSFNEIGAYWFNRQKKFTILSISKVAQTSSAELSKLGFGLLGMNFIGLIYGKLIGWCVAGGYFLYRFMKRDRSSLRLINTAYSNEVVRKNKQFILFTTPSTLLGFLINFIYIHLFFLYFGEDVVGNIGVSMTYLSAGFGIIAVSFSQVFYSKLAETKNKSALRTLYIRFAKNLFAFSLIPIILVYLIPSSMVVYLLGDAWVDLMNFSRIMVLWLAVWFVSSSLSFIYIRLGRQKEMVIFDVMHLGMVVLGFFIGFWIDANVYTALWGFAISQIVYYLFAIGIALYYIGRMPDSVNGTVQ